MVYTVEINGKVYTVFSLRDMMELIDECIGNEFRTILEEMLSETYAKESEWAVIEEEHKKELGEIREHYHGVIVDIRDQAEMLSELIRAQRLNRSAISSCAGRIGTITWREL